MKRVVFASSSVCIIFIYTVGVMIFGESHPFSKYSMYNAFADYSYAFYFTDENNKLIKCVDLNTTGTTLAHMYTTLCEKNNFSHGHGMESDSVLTVVGKQMLEIIKINANHLKLHNRKVKLNRIYFFCVGKAIKSKKHVMNETIFN